jgi:glycine cleavage system aminomethyltransferase T
LRRHLPDDGSVLINDVTSGRVCFALWGPRARDILAAVTRDDVSDGAFPYLTARAITVGFVPVYALRVTYVGELGWELYAHTEFGLALWRTLWEAGRLHGMVAAGYRAIDALRLEKGYRVWSSDITPDENPFEAGLGFAVALDKEPEFIGRDALVAAKAAGLRKRLRCLVLDDPRSVCLGNEPVRVGGEIVGRVTSGGYGFAVERSIAYAYLPPDRAAIGSRGEVEVFGDWIGFEVAREPLYDPEGSRIRA